MIALFQFNVATMREPYSSQLWDKWRQLVPVIHSQTETAEGFLWRYDGTEDPEGYIMPYPSNPMVMGNLSAWSNMHTLRKFTFGHGCHTALLRHREHWFEPQNENVLYNVMWWDHLVPNRSIVEHAVHQLELLREHGPTREVFGWERYRV